MEKYCYTYAILYSCKFHFNPVDYWLTGRDAHPGTTNIMFQQINLFIVQYFDQ